MYTENGKPHSVLEILRKAGYFHAPSEVSIWESWELPEGETQSPLCQGTALPPQQQNRGVSMRAWIRQRRGESRLS